MNDAKKWACDYCTFENWPSAIKCTLCRGTKPPRLIAEHGERDIYRVSELISPGAPQPPPTPPRGQLQLNVVNRDVSADSYHKWPCPRCTYLNWPKATNCVQCCTARARSSSPSSAVAGAVAEADAGADPGPATAAARRMSPTTPESLKEPNDSQTVRHPSARTVSKWSCSTCTYENWPKSLKCVICHTPRPNATATQHAQEELADSNRRNATDARDACTGPTIVQEASDPIVAAGGASTSTTSNNYEHEMRLRRLRKCMRDADWPWLKACMGVFDGDLGPVEAYLASGGDPSRQLSQSEVGLLSRPSAFEVGQTLIHLAIRFRREELLALLLAAAESPRSGLKRVPSHVSPDLAADIRRHVTACLRQRKGDFSCHFVTELVTFALPTGIEDLAPDVQEHLFDELLDRDVQKELEVESPIINWSLELTDRLGSRLYALWNRTAGDCLLDSILQATWGVFDRENTLRRALSDSLNEAANVFYPRWKEYEATQARLLHFTLDESQWQQDWSILLSLAGQPGAPLEQLHIFTVAHILRRPIIVYGVKFVKSFRGEAIGYARFEGVYLPMLWEPSFCWKTPIALGYTRGHFSALVTMEPDTDENVGAGALLGNEEDLQVTFLPLMTSDGSPLPIHFLPNAEVGREEQILRQWLECRVTESGILVAQQKNPRRPLLVAQMVEEWLNHYRRLCHVPPPAHQGSTVGRGQGYASDGDSDEE